MEIKAKIYQMTSTQKWTLNYIEPKENKRIRKSFPTKKAALVYLDELSSSLIQKRRTREGDKKIINYVIDEYLAIYPGSSFIKVKLYVIYFKEEFGKVNPKAITPTLLKDWMIKIRAKYNLSLKTLSHMKSQIQVIFQYMKREGYVAANPFKKITFKNRVDYYRRDKLSQDDMKKILENLYYYSPYFLYRFVYVLYYTGMTKQELTDLGHDHFNYRERRINIVSPKAGFVRSIIIPDHVAEMLKGQPRRNEYLLGNRLGRKIDPNNICRYLLRFRIRYPDTPEFNMENIKSASAFHFLERGGSLKELSDMLGHSSLDSTVRLYSRLRKVFWSGEAAADQEISAADWGIEVID
jgi:integrase